MAKICGIVGRVLNIHVKALKKVSHIVAWWHVTVIPAHGRGRKLRSYGPDK